MLKIISFVDIITNSSTSIYTKFCGSISSIHLMFNTILSLGESKFKSEDLFEIKECMDCEDAYRYSSQFRYTNLPESEIKELVDAVEKYVEDNGYTLEFDDFTSFLETLCEEKYINPRGIFDEINRLETFLTIVVKKEIGKEEKEKAESILSEINGLFTSDAVYDY